MADHPIHNPKDYSEVLRQLLTTDPVHADTLNPLFERLLNNDAFIKAAADKLASDLAAHIAASDPHPGYLLVSGGTLTGSLTFRDLLEGIVLASGGKITDQATGTVINAAEGTLTVTTEDGSTSLLALSSGVFKYLNNVVHHAGNHNNTGDPHTQYAKKAGDSFNGNVVVDADSGDVFLIARMDATVPGQGGLVVDQGGAYRTRMIVEGTGADARTAKAELRYEKAADKTLGKFAVFNINGFGRVNMIGADLKVYGGLLEKTRVSKSNKDANGQYTSIEYRRDTDGSLFLKSVLSNPDANGNYQTDTWTIYELDGVTVAETKVWTITYDADGSIVSVV